MGTAAAPQGPGLGLSSVGEQEKMDRIQPGGNEARLEGGAAVRKGEGAGLVELLKSRTSSLQFLGLLRFHCYHGVHTDDSRMHDP